MKRKCEVFSRHKIGGYDKMEPFFMTLASPSDHWLFLSSTGGLTAGRVSPENALFPYETVDKLHESWRHTGPKTIIFAKSANNEKHWEPFNTEISSAWRVERNLHKSMLGDEITFEEKNASLGLVFSYGWSFSREFGIVRTSRIQNTGKASVAIRALDGVCNIMPANTNRALQTESSCLLDAYKRAEALPEANLAVYYYNSIPTDKAQAMESLKATCAWSLGLNMPLTLLSSRQIANFAKSRPVTCEEETRGCKGSYLLVSGFKLNPGEERQWRIVLDVNQDMRGITKIQKLSGVRQGLEKALSSDIELGRSELAALLSSSDAFQCTEDAAASCHHLSNVLFNIMRGGVFADSGRISPADFLKYVQAHNKDVSRAAGKIFAKDKASVSLDEFDKKTSSSRDPNLRRIAAEYLPLTFSRRHGDPSRPWNHFSINVSGNDGERLLSYQGNWRDLFQNWEALCLSFPEFIFNVIAKFLNATSAEGYNPYRVSREGFEWEAPDPGNSWSNIGYWGDHQIIYLLRLLELAEKTFPGKVRELLHRKIYAYSNIPYRLKPYDEICADPRSTILFDRELDEEISIRSRQLGNDAKLLTGPDGKIIHVSMMEKIIVPLISKISNLVPEGGIWLNTQRPEWNDANNALAGHGLSMVTVCYLHRYMVFVERLLGEIGAKDFEMSAEIAGLMHAIHSILEANSRLLKTSPMTNIARKKIMDSLGGASCEFRRKLYEGGLRGACVEISNEEIAAFIATSLKWISHTISANERDDGLFHSYNVLALDDRGRAGIKNLDEMLEGQVAVLSSGHLDAAKAVRLLKSLRKSRMFREDQHSYTLYPDRELKTFAEKGAIPRGALLKSRALRSLLDKPSNGLVVRDAFGNAHFDPAMRNESDLELAIKKSGLISPSDIKGIKAVYEEVFKHSEFTGRAGSFFAYEGLGSIYWHMVSKLLLAVQENYFRAIAAGADKKFISFLLGSYCDIRKGLGFNKTAEEYGAFPTDPYSHTPKHAGASQPGMTGQVKEEIITRLGELGVSFSEGRISFASPMLPGDEFLQAPREFSIPFAEGGARKFKLTENTLLFTLCSVPVLYQVSDCHSIAVFYKDGSRSTMTGNTLDTETSRALFSRPAKIARITVSFAAKGHE